MQIDDPEIDPILKRYNEQLTTLILLANQSELTRSQFRSAVMTLVETFLLAAFLVAGGDSSNRSELDNLIDAHTTSVTRLTRDVFKGRYFGEENEGKITNRVNLWVASVAGAYSIGQVNNLQRLQVLEWQLGNTEQHCSDCLRLNGIALTREEWSASGWRPRIRRLECGGWNCDCRLILVDRASDGLGAIQ